MSLLESVKDRIKSMWYGGHNIDVYNSDDFGELWQDEDNVVAQKSFLNRTIQKSRGVTTTHCVINNNKENTNVIDHPSITSQSEVIVIEPRSFDEALEIVEELRCRRSVVLNLQYLDNEQSQRVVDFLSGATHALDGHQQRIGQGVFIFAPSNFTINTESQEARALKDAFWGRTKEKEQTTASYQYAEPVKKSSIF